MYPNQASVLEFALRAIVFAAFLLSYAALLAADGKRRLAWRGR